MNEIERTAGEFTTAGASESVNIPLNEVPNGLGEIEKMKQPPLLCCMSGNRSVQAYAVCHADPSTNILH